MRLAPGRIRGLQASATPRGIFTILAVDHRDALRAMIDAHAPESVSAARLTELKLVITRRLGPPASAVLLDPPYGAAPAIAAQALPGHAGLLCSLEEQGYLKFSNSNCAWRVRPGVPAFRPGARCGAKRRRSRARNESFIATVAQRRLTEWVEIAVEFGKPWQRRYSMPDIDEQWYRQY